MKLKYVIITSLLGVLLAACSKLKDDFNGLLTNPNQPSVTSADVDLYLNQVQLSFKNFFNDIQAYGDALTRMEIMFGPNYTSAYQPEAFDGIWTNAYSSIFTNTNAMLQATGEKYIHAGIAKVLKAYTMITLVDYMGNIPYTEANKGVENTNPAADDGKVVYDSALALLSQAITDLSQSAPAPTNDLFYGGDATKWTTLAKTLQLKAYVQMRLVDPSVKDKIQALLTENDLINSSDQDFEFKYGSQNLAPDSRHPKYAGNYTTGGAADYLGNYFMWTLYEEKGIIDPRIRYYFYRQTLDIEADITDPVTLQFTIPCLGRVKPSWYPANIPFCQVGDGYIGRDHGNNEGIPPDNQFRTTWGVYPAGGEFDADQGNSQTAAPGIGGKGQGINPIWLSSFTDFLRAEAALTLATGDDAETMLENGIRASFSKVFSFPATVAVTVPDQYVPTQQIQDDYVNLVKSNYEAASTTDAKLEVIMKEYYIALWGNGIEAYNNYRRTGKPSNMQPTVYAPSPGFFIRTFYYPSVYVNLNKNAAQKPNPGLQTVKVFWDNNPDNFVH